MTTRKLHDRAGGNAAKCVEDFNRQFPIGTAVWYWRKIPFGPVVETTVRGEAFVSDADLPVVFLKDVSGYVDIFHVTPPNESQRQSVEFA